MRINPIARAMTLGLALSVCATAGAAPARADASTLTIGQETRGEITSRSGINFNDGSRHQLYTLPLAQGQLVELVLSGPLDGVLTVLNDGLVVGSSSRGEDDRTTLAFRAAGAGRYTLAVNGDDANAYGPFVLAAREVQPYSGAPLAGQGSINDLYAGGQQEYTLQVSEQGMYRIDAVSTAFDTVLTLNGQGVDEEDDDGGSSTNSRISMMLEPGTYTLGVRSIGDGGSGQFRLSAAYTPLPAQAISQDGATVQVGTSAPVLLGRGDGQRRLQLVMPRAGKVRIDATSDEVDTFLRVTGGDVRHSNDDGGNGTDARIEAELPAGRYDLEVSNLEERQAIIQLQISAAN